MWAARYWNPRYWAARYWPKIGAEAEPPTPAPEAITARRALRRLRQSPFLDADGRFLTFAAFRLTLETGVGLTTGQGDDPQVMLRYSDDSGHTWSDEQWTSAGRRGRYKQRAEWRRLGRARRRVYQIVVSDPVKWTLLGADVEVQP